jgi:hypothetical protein
VGVGVFVFVLLAFGFNGGGAEAGSHGAFKKKNRKKQGGPRKNK